MGNNTLRDIIDRIEGSKLYQSAREEEHTWYRLMEAGKESLMTAAHTKVTSSQDALRCLGGLGKGFLFTFMSAALLPYELPAQYLSRPARYKKIEQEETRALA